jgi:hypothetical protein
MRSLYASFSTISTVLTVRTASYHRIVITGHQGTSISLIKISRWINFMLMLGQLIFSKETTALFNWIERATRHA